MDKRQVRSAVKALKKALTAEQKILAAARVFDQVERLPQFVDARNVLIYYSLPDELSTVEAIERWSGFKNLFLPRVNGDELDILPYDPSRLFHGAYNIVEPTGDALVDVADIDLIIVPGVAFDRAGNRLGRGKGFYDRLLRNSRAVKVGVAYKCQIVESIPTDEFDIPMDIIVADNELIIR
ncbi:MAG: 5-formyltetrahydrofolate cyclo-ligase [Muribaculaceae bacterium]